MKNGDFPCVRAFVIDPRFHTLGHGGAVLAAQVLPLCCEMLGNVGKMCGKDMEHLWKMSKCAFGLGIYDEMKFSWKLIYDND